MKGSGHRTHLVLSLTFGCGKFPLKTSNPMEFSNFSCEKPALFLLLWKAFQFRGLYVTNGLLLILNFQGLHGSQVRGLLCSSHLLSPPPALCLVTRADAGILGKYLGHITASTPNSFSNKKLSTLKQAGFTAG